MSIILVGASIILAGLIPPLFDGSVPHWSDSSARRLTLHLPRGWPWGEQVSGSLADCEPFHSQPDGGRLQPARQPHPPATPTSPKLAPDRPASVFCCVLSLAGEFHITVANRSPAPTVQNLPDNRASTPRISHSSTATVQLGGFGFSLSKRADQNNA